VREGRGDQLGQRGGRKEDERASVDAEDVSASFVVGKAELDTAVNTTGTEEGWVESVRSERRGGVN
jgi:hypothetical protein